YCYTVDEAVVLQNCIDSSEPTQPLLTVDHTMVQPLSGMYHGMVCFQPPPPHFTMPPMTMVPSGMMPPVYHQYAPQVLYPPTGMFYSMLPPPRVGDAPGLHQVTIASLDSHAPINLVNPLQGMAVLNGTSTHVGMMMPDAAAVPYVNAMCNQGRVPLHNSDA